MQPLSTRRERSLLNRLRGPSEEVGVGFALPRKGCVAAPSPTARSTRRARRRGGPSIGANLLVPARGAPRERQEGRPAVRRRRADRNRRTLVDELAREDREPDVPEELRSQAIEESARLAAAIQALPRGSPPPSRSSGDGGYSVAVDGVGPQASHPRVDVDAATRVPRSVAARQSTK